MKLKELTEKTARNFVIFWTVMFSLFTLMVIWTLVSGYQALEQFPGDQETRLWPQAFLMFLVFLSLLCGTVGMWKHYYAGEYGKIRTARNISFILVLFLYPLGIIINVLLANFY